LQCDEHVGRFDVAVDDPLLVRVVNRLTNLCEQVQPVARRQSVLITKLGDG